jgi:hypothetical protein
MFFISAHLTYAKLKKGMSFTDIYYVMYEEGKKGVFDPSVTEN